MPRRISDYPDAFAGWNFISSFGSIISVVATFLFLYILNKQLVAGNLTSKYPWLTPQFYSDLFQTLFNRTFNSLEWSLNSPPKPHSFVTLPLQSSPNFYTWLTEKYRFNRAEYLESEIESNMKRVNAINNKIGGAQDDIVSSIWNSSMKDSLFKKIKDLDIKHKDINVHMAQLDPKQLSTRIEVESRVNEKVNDKIKFCKDVQEQCLTGDIQVPKDKTDEISRWLAQLDIVKKQRDKLVNEYNDLVRAIAESQNATLELVKINSDSEEGLNKSANSQDSKSKTLDSQLKGGEKPIETELPRNSKEENTSKEQSKGSLIKDFADPNLEQPTYTDPED